MKNGFTLVEMLVVIGVLSIVGILVLIIFINTLRGSNKSQIIVSIKQNGQSVLESMSSNIRNSDNIICPAITAPSTTASSSNLVIGSSKGLYIRYRFISPGTNSNGMIQQDNPAKELDSTTGEEETDAVFINRVCTVDNPMMNAVVLTDTNSQSGVSLISGNFTRDRSAGFKDNVVIDFILSHAVNAPVSVAGQIDPVTFKTTVQLR